MDDTEQRLRDFAAEEGYGLYLRQALRFMVEVGGHEALDRFEHMTKDMIASRPDTDNEEMNCVRDVAAEMVEKAFSDVRNDPDLI